MLKNLTPKVKCVVWDLDDTIWQGILAEGDQLVLKPEIVDLIKLLDAYGILQAVSSRYDYSTAVKVLEDFNLKEYFVCLEITWNDKSQSIAKIAENLNIGKDSIVFVDDQKFEREEVSFNLSKVICIDPAELPVFINQLENSKGKLSDEARNRRSLYELEQKREKYRSQFDGEERLFLNSLNLELIICDASEETLSRASELTHRTNQLNTTGITYSEEELRCLALKDDHKVRVASLKDRFGDYGVIALIVTKESCSEIKIKLLLTSCRVMSRGVGSMLIFYLADLARSREVGLFSDFIRTEKNRAMYMTYMFNGFDELDRNGDKIRLKADLSKVGTQVSHVKIITH